MFIYRQRSEMDRVSSEMEKFIDGHVNFQQKCPID